MSERADTAYSPRFREEEHSAAAEEIAVYFSDAPHCNYRAYEIAPCKTRGTTLPRCRCNEKREVRRRRKSKRRLMALMWRKR